MNNRIHKIPVAILGATGMVGQKFLELLIDHPWFEVVSLAASERSAGKRYQDAAAWRMGISLPVQYKDMVVSPCDPNLPCQVVFSALDSDVAGEIEEKFAKAGYLVISNSKNHRMAAHVPLIIPEVNAEHLELTKFQPFGKGAIVTNPNCSVVGLAMALKPLSDRWGVSAAHVVTMQALSGAGYPGVSSFDILDNVIPHITGEEEKIQTEPLKVLGEFKNGSVVPYQIKISAQCNRVPVMDGHLASISVKLKNSATFEEIVKGWNSFEGEPQRLKLPLAPQNPVVYHREQVHPQPRLHRLINGGMTVSIGGLRKCPLYDWKFTLLSHNTVRGAAGCAILIAELMAHKGYI